MFDDHFIIDLSLAEVGMFLFFVLAGIALCSWASYEGKHETEQKCVTFYEEHGYILDSCNDFANKLGLLDIEEKGS